MPEMSEKTRLEMETGAKTLADKNGTSLPPGYMDAIIRTHSRHAQLRQWEAAGKLMIEHTKRYRSGNVRYKRDNVDTPPETWHTVVRVLPKRGGGVTFNDIEAERTGGFPSEVLIANIALYLQSEGEL